MFSLARGIQIGRRIAPELRKVCTLHKLGPLESALALGGAAVGVLVESKVLTVNKPKLAALAAELGYSWSA